MYRVQVRRYGCTEFAAWIYLYGGFYVESARPVSVVIAQFQGLHSEMRLEVTNRNDASLNWTPCSGANSVATIVTHTLGSEAEQSERSPE